MFCLFIPKKFMQEIFIKIIKLFLDNFMALHQILNLKTLIY